MTNTNTSPEISNFVLISPEVALPRLPPGFFFSFSQKFPPQVATSLPRQFAVPAHVTDDKLVAELIHLTLSNSSEKATT